MKSIFVLLFVILKCVSFLLLGSDRTYAFRSGVYCLQNVRVIFPESVPEGGVATLLCLYDLQGDPLYSVKWYRGNYEIFRYIPKENPRTKIFPLPGLYVDSNSSNAHRLIVLDIPKHLGGNYTCEVSADAPAYSTGYKTEFLKVIRNVSEIYKITNKSHTRFAENERDDFNITGSNMSTKIYKNHCDIVICVVLLLLLCL